MKEYIYDGDDSIMLTIDRINDWRRKTLVHRVLRSIWYKLKKVLFFVKNLRYYERRVSFGKENPDKVFYLVRRVTEEGMGSETVNCASDIAYALKKGYIPVVDRKNYYDPLIQGKEKKGVENAWEYYYYQPAGYSLDDVYRSKNVILSNAVNSKHWVYRDKSERIIKDYKYRRYCKKLWNKSIKPVKDLSEVLQKSRNEINSLDGKVLGVSTRLRYRVEYIRYLKNQKKCYFSGHGRSVEPDINELINDIEEKCLLWNCEFIYFCDDTSLFEKELKGYFGDRLLIKKRRRVNNSISNSFVSGSINNAKDDRSLFFREYEKIDGIVKENYLYLQDIAALSACDCLMGTINSTSLMAVMLNEDGFENEWFYDKGIY